MPDLAPRFRGARKRQLAIAAVLGIGFTLIPASRIGRITNNDLLEWTLAGSALLLIAIGGVLWVVNWRCPACRGFLGWDIRLRTCPKCFAQLA